MFNARKTYAHHARRMGLLFLGLEAALARHYAHAAACDDLEQVELAAVELRYAEDDLIQLLQWLGTNKDTITRALKALNKKGQGNA
jgi:hypothetical protein